MVIDINNFKNRYSDIGPCSLGNGVALTSSGIYMHIEGDWKVINTKLFIKLVKIGALLLWV